MAMPNNKPDDVLNALLDFAEDHELEIGEAREELVREGVDVSAFLARVHNRVEQARKAERLQWQYEARRKREDFDSSRKKIEVVSKIGRSELLALLAQVYARNSSAHAHHKNLEELTDDDLRTALLDFLRLEEQGRK
jgi:vacuolar-type H+-ATPase subunit I/STV1